MIAHCIRFWPQYERIRAEVSSGTIGRLRYLKLRRLGSPPTYSAGNWLLDHRLSGGALLDLHVHDIDFVQDWLGLPNQIQAVGQQGPSGGIDHVLAAWAYPEVMVHLEGGWAYHTPRVFEMEITAGGEAGMLIWNSAAGSAIHCYGGGEQPRTIACPDQTGWECTVDYFVQNIVAGTPFTRCSAESSARSVALALAEAEAIATLRPVRPADCVR
jgi:predicted dehydrogenase